MKKKIVTALMVAGLMAMNTVSLFAVVDEDIYLRANQVWCPVTKLVNNSGNHSYVYARCDAVFPESGDDNFKKIQVRLSSLDPQIISRDPYQVLTEGTQASRVYIKEGFISTTPILFEFRGNSNASANARVDYWAN